MTETIELKTFSFNLLYSRPVAQRSIQSQSLWSYDIDALQMLRAVNVDVIFVT